VTAVSAECAGEAYNFKIASAFHALLLVGKSQAILREAANATHYPACMDVIGLNKLLDAFFQVIARL